MSPANGISTTLMGAVKRRNVNAWNNHAQPDALTRNATQAGVLTSNATLTNRLLQTLTKMIARRQLIPSFLAVALICAFTSLVKAQTATDDQDPVKLFELGQDAHAKSDYKKAIELYDAAIKLKPEFPEAEFQRALALLFTNQKDEAIEGFNRAMELRPDWAFAYARFGSLLSSYYNDDRHGEPMLRRALELDANNIEALIALADLRARAHDLNEALALSKRATASPNATSSTWRKRSFIELSAGDKPAALASVTQALTVDANDLGARYDRAKLRLDLNDMAGAYEDLRALEKAGHGSNVAGAFELAQFYERAGKREDALRILDSLNQQDQKRPEMIALRAEIAGGDGSTAEERAALEQLLEHDPTNASLLARLGTAYRRIDPDKSSDYFYRALKVDPKNTNYAIGYASALVQARRFPDAINILRQILAKSPDEYLAHTNLALALYELKDFGGAIAEYEWIANKRPELAATYFFLAVAHDNLQEYEDALDAYQKFLTRADQAANKLEIEKVNLRLPILRDQIKRGQGKRKPNID
jgi:tetratricopeptide (TPR) repeat protein